MRILWFDFQISGSVVPFFGKALLHHLLNLDVPFAIIMAIGLGVVWYMENSIISEYYEMIFDKMKTDKLIGEDGAPLFQSEDDFCRYCKRIIQESESETLQAEVMSLEKLVSHYQERFNIVGSVHKAFFEETPNGKEYKYLHIEQMLSASHYLPMRFMDWLLEQYCYMQFSKVFPDYIEHLQNIGLNACFDSFTHELYRKFYFK